MVDVERFKEREFLNRVVGKIKPETLPLISYDTGFEEAIALQIKHRQILHGRPKFSG
jgi:hypothetical protein